MPVKPLSVALILSVLLQDTPVNVNVRLDMLEMLQVIKGVNFVKCHAISEAIVVKINTVTRVFAKVSFPLRVIVSLYFHKLLLKRHNEKTFFSRFMPRG